MNPRSGLVPRLPRPAWVVLGGDALSALGSGLTLPFLLIYFHQVRGFDLSVAGLAVAALPFASLVGNPLGGWLADRGGARDVVLIGLVTSATGTVLITLVRDPWHAFLAAGTVGLGAAVTWPAQDALLAGLVSPEQRSSVFSLRHATLNGGLGLGALVAAAIVDVSSPRSFVILYLVDAASYLAFVPILLTLPRRRPAPPDPEEDAPAGSYREVLRDRVFVRVWLLTALVVAVGYGQFHAGFPAYATRPGGITPGALSIAFAANTFVVVGAQLFVLRRLGGRHRTFAVRLACAGWALTWALTLVAGQLGGGVLAAGGFLVALVVFAFAETCMSPTLPAIVNDLAPEALRGRYNGLSTLAFTTGFLSGPIVAGFALDAGAGTALFLGLIGACGLAILGSFRLERHLPPAANVIGVEEPAGVAVEATGEIVAAVP